MCSNVLNDGVGTKVLVFLDEDPVVLDDAQIVSGEGLDIVCLGQNVVGVIEQSLEGISSLGGESITELLLHHLQSDSGRLLQFPFKI